VAALMDPPPPGSGRRGRCAPAVNPASTGHTRAAHRLPLPGRPGRPPPAPPPSRHPATSPSGGPHPRAATRQGKHKAHAPRALTPPKPRTTSAARHRPPRLTERGRCQRAGETWGKPPQSPGFPPGFPRTPFLTPIPPARGALRAHSRHTYRTDLSGRGTRQHQPPETTARRHPPNEETSRQAETNSPRTSRQPQAP
jgi:hypothetical protein